MVSAEDVRAGGDPLLSVAVVDMVVVQATMLSDVGYGWYVVVSLPSL